MRWLCVEHLAVVENEIMNHKADNFYKSESGYRMLVENSCDIIFSLSPSGEFTFVSPALRTLLGYDNSAIVSHHFREFLHPDDVEACEAAVSASFATGELAEHTYRILHADGSWRWQTSKGAPHQDESGTRTFIGIARDISDLQRAAERLEEFKQSLTAILDTLPSIIVTVDRLGCVELVNRRFELLSGIVARDAHGLQLEVLLPQFRDQLRQVAEVIDHRIPVTHELIQHRSATACRYYSLHIYPLTSEDSGMAVIRIEDISEHVRIEEIMLQTEKMSIVGGLAAGMAHEINNPLGAIMQNAQNIERRVSPDIAANLVIAAEVGVSLELVRAYLEKRGIFDFIGHIRTAGMRAAAIITDMLHFSRRGEARTETVDLATVLDETLKLAASDYDMKKRYDFRKIKLVREYAPDLPPVSMIVSDVEQALLNILKNAAQAMAGSGQAEAAHILLQTALCNGMAVIRIVDNGPGMDEATRLRIFEPFFSTKPVGSGTGLGLSVAYAIITKGHHGLIEVQSRPGKGCCFSVMLPVTGVERTGGFI
jgi:PAS domain S-box-containing protein